MEGIKIPDSRFQVSNTGISGMARARSKGASSLSEPGTGKLVRRIFRRARSRSRPVSAFLLLVSVSWLLSSVLGPSSSLAAEFTAELIRYYGSEEEGRSRVFVKGDKRREEYMDEGEVSGVSIIRSDLGVIWTLMSEEKVYLEVRIKKGLQAPLESLRELDRIGMKKVLGTETLNGYDCEIVRYTPRDQNQGTLTLWFSEALGYPVRVQIDIPGEEQQSMVFTAIRPGPISESRFQIPAGYGKVGLPGGR